MSGAAAALQTLDSLAAEDESVMLEPFHSIMYAVPTYSVESHGTLRTCADQVHRGGSPKTVVLASGCSTRHRQTG